MSWVCGKAESAPIPSAHDRKAVSSHRLLSPSTFGKGKRKQWAWRRKWGGASETTGFKTVSAFWRQIIGIHTYPSRLVSLHSFQLTALQSFHLLLSKTFVVKLVNVGRLGGSVG